MKNIEKKNKAIQICLESKETLTPNRITILELLLDSEAPISAYDLSTKLKNRGKNRVENRFKPGETYFKPIFNPIFTPIFYNIRWLQICLNLFSTLFSYLFLPKIQNLF